LEALEDFPSQESRLFTEKGIAFCQKTDIFKGMLWFSYKDDPSNWHALTKEQVKEILDKNKVKKPVASLEEFAVENIEEEKLIFENVVGQDSLTRFDRPKRKNKGGNNKKRRNNRKRPAKNA
jgi:hypothetical protein